MERLIFYVMIFVMGLETVFRLALQVQFKLTSGNVQNMIRRLLKRESRISCSNTRKVLYHITILAAALEVQCIRLIGLRTQSQKMNLQIKQQ
jgi:hypothetical protein